MKQGYNSRLDESMGARNRRSSRGHFKARRDESKGMEKSLGRRAYAAVGTMDRHRRGGMSCTKHGGRKYGGMSCTKGGKKRRGGMSCTKGGKKRRGHGATRRRHGKRTMKHRKRKMTFLQRLGF